VIVSRSDGMLAANLRRVRPFTRTTCNGPSMVIWKHWLEPLHAFADLVLTP